MASRDRPLIARAVLGLVIVAAIGLSACGRKGPLEAPPTAAATDPAAPAAMKEPEKKPSKPFILDPLL